MPELLTTVAAELEARVTEFVAEHRLPGAMAGVIAGGGLAWSAGAGFADVARRRPPDPATLYRIASITKTFTATAIMRLAEAGRLHLDDPAVAHLPELRRASSPFGPIETVTIRRLLAHQAGLPVDPPGTDLSAPGESEPFYEGLAERSLAQASELGPRIPPDLNHKYSNLGYQLLGEIVARVSGSPYTDYVRETILEPLGLADTAFEPLPPALAGRRATGYQDRTFSDQLETAPAFPALWAEGGLWSCLADVARWVSFQLSPYDSEPPAARVLSQDTLRVMHQPHYLVDAAWTQARGIGWGAYRREDAVWIQHSGGLPGYRSNACFDRDSRVGAVVLINGGGDAAALAMDLAGIARRAVLARPRRIEPPAPVPDGWRSLLGLYATPLGPDGADHVLRLEWRDGKLTFVDPAEPGWRPVLEPGGEPDVFVVGPGHRQSGELVRFRRRADGRVTSAFLAEFTLVRLDRLGS
ncbi:MAG TPA: serine hydrolase domain-containing protein [Streptosporangiaceae bacterium]|nr:serine hydrolase domain-containing protein [Streptosporangiaceae bacterium]